MSPETEDTTQNHKYHINATMPTFPFIEIHIWNKIFIIEPEKD